VLIVQSYDLLIRQRPSGSTFTQCKNTLPINQQTAPCTPAFVYFLESNTVKVMFQVTPHLELVSTDNAMHTAQEFLMEFNNVSYVSLVGHPIIRTRNNR
jgi:hypothetical protein